MIGELEKNNQKHTLFTMLIHYGSKHTCNEHLEGQRDVLPYITVIVGTVSAASRLEALMQRFTHVFDSFTRRITSPLDNRPPFCLIDLMRFLLMDAT